MTEPYIDPERASSATNGVTVAVGQGYWGGFSLAAVARSMRIGMAA